MEGEKTLCAECGGPVHYKCRCMVQGPATEMLKKIWCYPCYKSQANPNGPGSDDEEPYSDDDGKMHDNDDPEDYSELQT